MLTASDDRSVRIFDAFSGQCLQVFEGHGDHVYGACFSPDGRHVLTAGEDGTAKLFSVAAAAAGAAAAEAADNEALEEEF